MYIIVLSIKKCSRSKIMGIVYSELSLCHCYFRLRFDIYTKCNWVFDNSSLHGQNHKPISKHVVPWELFSYVKVKEGNPSVPTEIITFQIAGASFLHFLIRGSWSWRLRNPKSAWRQGKGFLAFFLAVVGIMDRACNHRSYAVHMKYYTWKQDFPFSFHPRLMLPPQCSSKTSTGRLGINCKLSLWAWMINYRLVNKVSITNC